jgi:lysophospholipid acyltransferase (LPLAT)-like uncharacterized protein
MEITIKDQLNGFGLFFLSQIFRVSCRFQINGLENFHKAFESKKPLITPTWHGNQMIAITFVQKYSDISSFVTLMPDDWRGASLKVFADYLGAQPFPMNLYGDTTMDQGRQLAKIVRLLKGGKNLAIAPDGPDGPSYIIKPGLTYFAKKTNALILPLGGYCRNGYVMQRWDQYVLPYPFSRISVQIGEPYEVPKDVNDLAEIDEYLTDQLNHVAMQAAANYY